MRVSNRVFWAAVFLLGCAVVSGRNQNAEAGSDTLRAKRLEVQELRLVTAGGATRASLRTYKDSAILSIGSNPDDSGVIIAGGHEKNGVVIIRGEDGELLINSKKSLAAASLPANLPSKQITSVTPRTLFTKSFSGSNNKTTESFYVPSNRWKVTWHAESDEDFGHFSISLIEAKTGSPVGLIANTLKPGGDTSYFYKKGEYYFNISASVPYEITVEEIP